MRLGAPFFARAVAEDLAGARAIFCSSFLDVAAFRGLLPPEGHRLPVFVYFHENQFAYPVRVHDERDFHFALTNITTALAADSVAFNSAYNLDTLVAGYRDLARKCDDMEVAGVEETIRAKSRVLFPGIDFHAIDAAGEGEDAGGGAAPLIIWNHRWEHDKGPEIFFTTLYRLQERGVGFRLAVAGQSFVRQPGVFAEARERLAGRIVHFGTVAGRENYARLLASADVVVSTAGHEFYGISVIEAVRAGCRPLLPDRLSYPGLFPAEFLYADNDLDQALVRALEQGRLGRREGRRLTERFSWEEMGPLFAAWLKGEGRRANT